MTVDDAFRRFPVLNTARFCLRETRANDAEAFFALKSDEKVTSAYGQEPHGSLDDTRGWIQRLQSYYDKREAIFWCVTPKGEKDVAIGSCTFWNFGPGFQCAELGYELNRSYWRRGVMAEVIPTILSYGFTELGLHRIEAAPLARNTPSRNLLLKLGFSFEGNLRQRLSFRGNFEDQHYFGLLKEEWLKSGRPSAKIPDTFAPSDTIV